MRDGEVHLGWRVKRKIRDRVEGVYRTDRKGKGRREVGGRK